MRRLSLLLVLSLGLLVVPLRAHAATPPSEFNLQVTPSPLVTTVKPGTKTQVDLKIRNGGSGTEDLKMEPRSFKLSSNSQNVTLEDTTPPDIASWIKFSAPKFSIQPGQWFTETITFTVPRDAGFSYSFALVVSRQSLPKSTDGSRVIAGSLAVFTLVNVDRPDATSSIAVKEFKTSKKLYEYLPTEFSVQFKNRGNTIVQPYGNIFVQRSAEDKTPLATLPVNESRGYILPNVERTITASWSDGFPAYRTTQNTDGTAQQKLVWNWTQLSKLRIGRYTAHLVAVYSQNGRDVPIEGNVTFWVVPWKILLVLLVITLLFLFGFFMLGLVIWRAMKRRRAKKKLKKATPAADSTAEETV
jgi:hypothetical protein